MYTQKPTKSITNADSPYTLETLYSIILVDTSGGAVVITLPTVASMGVVHEADIVHDVGGASITVNANVADDINDNQASKISNTEGEVFNLKTIANNRISIKTNL